MVGMLPSISALVSALILLPFAGLVGAAELADCKLPTWTIKDVKISSYDSVGRNGTASFTFTNNMTGKSDSLNCTLVANYRCEIDGTPSESSLKINLQSQTGVLYVFVAQNQTCDGMAVYVSPFAVLSPRDSAETSIRRTRQGTSRLTSRNI